MCVGPSVCFLYIKVERFYWRGGKETSILCKFALQTRSLLSESFLITMHVCLSLCVICASLNLFLSFWFSVTCVQDAASLCKQNPVLGFKGNPLFHRNEAKHVSNSQITSLSCVEKFPHLQAPISCLDLQNLNVLFVGVGFAFRSVA